MEIIKNLLKIKMRGIMGVCLAGMFFISSGWAQACKYSEEEAKLYYMAINPITPKDGIWTGHVIAYGHYIKPPYKFEIREDTLLFVNNVRVYPPLVSNVSRYRQRKLEEEANRKRELSEPYMSRFEYLLDVARKVYKEVTLNKGRDAAIDSLYKIFKNDTLLKKILVDIKIKPTGESDATMGISLRYPGFGGPKNFPSEFIVPFYLNPPKPAFPKFKSKEERIAARKEALKRRIKRYERKLKDGYVLLFSSFNRLPNTIGINSLFKIAEILHSSKTFEEKCAELKKIFEIKIIRDEKEILYNYNPDEWLILLKKLKE